MYNYKKLCYVNSYSNSDNDIDKNTKQWKLGINKLI